MAGYIGSKAVTLSTTAADVTGDATINGNLTVNGTTVTIDSAAAQEIRLGDNDKLTFGDATGGDLQIYHDGFNSYIDDAGTGGLIVRADNFYVRKANDVENMIIGSADGAVTLYHDNATKLATTSTGVDITGTLTSDGLTVDGASSIRHSDATTNISLTPTSTGGVVNVRDSSGNSQIVLDARTSQVGIGTSSPSNKLHVQSSGSGIVALFGDSVANNYLAVTRTTTNPAYVGLHATSNVGGLVAGSALTLNTSAADGTSVTERMRIKDSGNVGINESSPDTKLHVSNNQSATPIATIENTASHEATIRFKTAHSADSDFRVGASISASNNFEIYSVNAATSRLVIDSSGQVGINTNSPNNYYAKKLVIDTGSDVQNGMTIVSGTSASGMIAFADGASGASAYRGYFDYSHASDTLAIGTGGSEAMRIDASGNFLLGKTSVSWTIDGTQIENGGETLGVTSSLTGNNFFARKNNATGTMFAFWYNSTNIGNITSGTSSVAYNTSSDYRLKENVTDVTDGITRVKQLNPKRFNFIADPDTTVDGFIAHEAQAVVPEAVTGTHNEVDDDGNAVMQGIDQSKLVPLLTAALQEAIAKIETLETEMTSVKARLDALEAE